MGEEKNSTTDAAKWPGLASNGGETTRSGGPFIVMNSPLWNELRCGARALLRDGPAGRRRLRALACTEAMTAAQLHALQAALLHRTLRSAIARLPHYAHIRPDFPEAASFDVLRESFPVIDKEALLAHGGGLYPTRAPWHAVGRTSGTTGTPLAVLRSAESVLMERAFVKRHWAWGGYRDGMVRATLRGDLVVDAARALPPFWFWNRYNRQLLVSSRHLCDAHADAIIDRLDALAPAMLQAYPSTAFALAGLLQARGRRLRIGVVQTASEPLHEHQRGLIAEWLGAKVMDMYGMAERVAFASECEHGNLHINPDYAYVEIIDGFVVGTTFHNQAMPLVRYRLSDRTEWKHGACACGRAFPMIEPVTGKFEDTLTGGHGAPVSASVLTFAFKGLANIRKSQVAQVGPGSWEVRVVPAPGFTQQDQQYLVDNIHRLVDPHVAVKVVLKDELPTSAAGKFRWVVNEFHPSKDPPA
jgi:phenylacetate-CoA ligase